MLDVDKPTEIERFQRFNYKSKIYPYQQAIIDELNLRQKRTPLPKRRLPIAVISDNTVEYMKQCRERDELRGLHDNGPIMIHVDDCHAISDGLWRAVERRIWWQRNRAAIIWTGLILFICMWQVFLRG